jgi:ubiquinone/menaquinone biosynthesis C-methylase UbiE
VFSQGYTESFGLQWTRFSKTQLDSAQQTNRSLNRFVSETQWKEAELSGKIVIDAGCGAGRFAEIVEKFNGHLIAVDYSSAVDVAYSNLRSDKALLIQADLTTLPFESGFADYVYCIGVLQHTSSPELIIEELLRILKAGGEMTLTFYENSSWHVLLYSKYLIRPLTKRIPKRYLLAAIEKSSVIWFPLTKFLFSLPYPLNRMFRFVIPIANYVEYEYSNAGAAKDEAILDTFDMLSPEYDKPIKRKHMHRWISNSNYEVVFLDRNNLKGTVRVRKVS